MSGVRIDQLEALRTTCLAAVTAAQAALQTVESLITGDDETEPNAPADEFAHLTFEDSPPPIRRRTNGQR